MTCKMKRRRPTLKATSWDVISKDPSMKFSKNFLESFSRKNRKTLSSLRKSRFRPNGPNLKVEMLKKPRQTPRMCRCQRPWNPNRSCNVTPLKPVQPTTPKTSYSTTSISSSTKGSTRATTNSRWWTILQKLFSCKGQSRTKNNLKIKLYHGIITKMLRKYKKFQLLKKTLLLEQRLRIKVSWCCSLKASLVVAKRSWCNLQSLGSKNSKMKQNLTAMRHWANDGIIKLLTTWFLWILRH